MDFTTLETRPDAATLPVPSAPASAAQHDNRRSIGFLSLEEEQAALSQPWVGSLSNAARMDLFCSALVRRDGIGGQLMHQGSASPYWFCVTSGAVQLRATTVSGRQILLGIAGPGEWFGDLSIFGGAHEPFDAIVVSSATLLMIHRQAVSRLLTRHAEIGPAVLGMASLRSRDWVLDIVEQHTLLMRGKVARRLLHLALRFGVADDEGHWDIPLHLSQTVLANFVGASRQRVNLCLQELARTGLIRYAQGRFTVLSIPGLQKLLQ